MSSYILGIHTTLADVAFVMLLNTQTKKIEAVVYQKNQKEFAAWLHTAIQQLLKDANINWDAIVAIAVTLGPGSYTGIRVGLAAAKGLAFATNVPLLGLNTLEMMAQTIYEVDSSSAGYYVAPLIDARRNEVFAGLYQLEKEKLKPQIVPQAIILSNANELERFCYQNVVAVGNGIHKEIVKQNFKTWKLFENEDYTIGFATLALHQYNEGANISLINASPVYLKEFNMK